MKNMIRKLKSLTSGEVINPDIVRENIPDGAVNNAKLADNAVDSAKIGNGAVNTAKIFDGAVTNSKLRDGTIRTEKIDDGAITNDKLGNNSVTSIKISDLSVTKVKLSGELQTEINFTENERNKTLNLWMGDIIENSTIEPNGLINTTSGFKLAIVKIEQGKTYTFNGTALVGYYTSYPTLGSVSYDGTRHELETFTAPISGYVALRYFTDTTDIMVNEGSTSLPYQPYNGAIIHQKDIEPVLLWENATPSVDFASGDITASENPLNYKYIVVMFKTYKTNDEIKIQKFGSVAGTTSFNGTFYTSSKLWNIARNITFTNSTTISLDAGVYQEEGVTGTSNGVAIPIAIYGTNLL